MAHTSGVSEDQLGRINDWYVREEPLRQAITTLITYHRTLPLTFKFGTGTTLSSDGIRFGIAASALMPAITLIILAPSGGETLQPHQ